MGTVTILKYKEEIELQKIHYAALFIKTMGPAVPEIITKDEIKKKLKILNLRREKLEKFIEKKYSLTNYQPLNNRVY